MTVFGQAHPEIPVLASLVKLFLVVPAPTREQSPTRIDRRVRDKVPGLVVGRVRVQARNDRFVRGAKLDVPEPGEVPGRVRFEHPARLFERGQFEQVVVVERDQVTRRRVVVREEPLDPDVAPFREPLRARIGHDVHARVSRQVSQYGRRSRLSRVVADDDPDKVLQRLGKQRSGRFAHDLARVVGRRDDADDGLREVHARVEEELVRWRPGWSERAVVVDDVPLFVVDW